MVATKCGALIAVRAEKLEAVMVPLTYVSPATENCASDGVVVPTPTRPLLVTMRAVLVAVGVEVEMRKRVLVESGAPAMVIEEVAVMGPPKKAEPLV